MSGAEPTSEGGSPKEEAPTCELTAFLEEDFAWMNWADEVERLTLNDEAPRQQLPDAKDKASQSSQPYVDISKVPNAPPFVAIVLNLPFDTSEDDLANFFSGIRITCVQLVHQNDGNMVGASYVEFRDRDSLICALQRTGKSLNNRTIRVEVFCGSAKDRRFGDGHGRRAYADGGKAGSAYRGRRSSEASSSRNDRDGRQLLRRAQMPNDVRATDYARRTNSVDQPPSERDNRYNSLPRGYIGRYGSHDAEMPSGPPQLTERRRDTFPRGGGGFPAGRQQEVPYFRSMSKSENRQGPRSMHERVPYRFASNQSTPDSQFDRYHGGGNVAPASSYRQRRSSAQSDSERFLGLHPDQASYDPSRTRGNQGGPGKFDRQYGSLNRNRMGQGHRFGRQDEGYFPQNFGRNRFADSWRASGGEQQHETIPKQEEGAAEANVSTESVDLPKDAETTVQRHLPYSSIFGEAKPVDTERRVREIEQQRLAMLRQESVHSVPPNMGSSKRPSNAFVVEPNDTVCDRYDEEDLLASGEIKLLRRPTPRKEEAETIAASQTSQAAAEPRVEQAADESQMAKATEDTYKPRGWGGGGRASRRSRGHRGGRRSGAIGRGSYVRGYGVRSNRQNSRTPLEPPRQSDGGAPSLQAAPAFERTSVSDARRSSSDKNDCVQSYGSVTRTESRASSVSNGRDGYRYEHVIEFRRGGSHMFIRNVVIQFWPNAACVCFFKGSVSTTRLSGPGESAKGEHTATPLVNEGQTAKREKVAQQVSEPPLVAPTTSTGAARANKPKEDRYSAAAGRHGRGKGSKRNAKVNGRQAFTDKNKFDLLKSFVCDD
ncbi:hypothetical protein M514_03371 [Trichuris suis]|uniref:RRM domain-containing protein n=1 Tax=Trichuris suis TaxID=68888 RepID=A0A085NEY9_9BILA|nr:hypothetical protein M514_03371 [Trichuris suis]